MPDEFQAHFPWIADWLKRPISDFFETGSREYNIIRHFSKGWGKGDTVEFLKELTEKYGNAAGRTVQRYAKMNTIKDWTEIGKKEARGGTEIDDLIRVLWEPLMKIEGFEITMNRENDTVIFYTTKCPIHDLAKKTGMNKWLFQIACSTDIHGPGAFSKKIGFKRTKTLMQGKDCCNHRYYYVKRDNSV